VVSDEQSILDKQIKNNIYDRDELIILILSSIFRCICLYNYKCIFIIIE
jgi:hypothetical protein